MPYMASTYRGAGIAGIAGIAGNAGNAGNACKCGWHLSRNSYRESANAGTIRLSQHLLLEFWSLGGQALYSCTAFPRAM